jgi:hypothetical protein
MSMQTQQRVNCRVLTVAGGGKHLVFEVKGTGEVVGEVRVIVANAGYLPVIGDLFSRWARGAWSVPSGLTTAIKRAINGG